MPSLLIANEPIHYELSGAPDGPVLVFSNSLGTTLSLWSDQVEALRSHFRILRYDTRGHGESAKRPGPYTLDQLGNDVLALTSALDIDRFHFCGISMGGLIGQWLGIHAGDKLQRLVICNTAAKIGTSQAWQERAALVRNEGMEPVAATTASRWFTEGYIKQHPEQVSRWVDDLRRTDPEGYAACCEALSQADLREAIQRITVPTLVLTGSSDPVTTPADADLIASRIAGAERIDLPASHLSNLEAPSQFNEALRTFLLA